MLVPTTHSAGRGWRRPEARNPAGERPNRQPSWGRRGRQRSPTMGQQSPKGPRTGPIRYEWCDRGGHGGTVPLREPAEEQPPGLPRAGSAYFLWMGKPASQESFQPLPRVRLDSRFDAVDGLQRMGDMGCPPGARARHARANVGSHLHRLDPRPRCGAGQPARARARTSKTSYNIKDSKTSRGPLNVPATFLLAFIVVRPPTTSYQKED